MLLLLYRCWPSPVRLLLRKIAAIILMTMAMIMPPLMFATTILALAKKRIAGEKIDLSIYEPKWLTPKEQEVFDRVLFERRSVRQWDRKRRVDDALIDRVLKAGLWGPHGCNLQSIRYMVIREEIMGKTTLVSSMFSGFRERRKQ